MVNPQGVYDVIIPTKNYSNIRVNLLWLLQVSRKWVREIIVETSKPLSIARKNGALKCTSDWVVMVDDDCELEEDWFEKATALIRPGVLAVSSMYEEQNIHMRAYLDFFKEHKRNYSEMQTANINTSLIKREVLINANPPAMFHCEDNWWYNYITQRGSWVHFEGSAKHWLKFRGSNFESGRNAKRLELVA